MAGLVTFEVKCEACGEELGGGYAAEKDSILDAALDHTKEHRDADDAEED